MVDPLVVGTDGEGGGDVGLVGGKAAQFRHLRQVDGVTVPEGFCVTTAAYRNILTAEIRDLIERLCRCSPDDLVAIGGLAAQIRVGIESVPVDVNTRIAIERALPQTGEQRAYAVRSSATAEDSPNASFAGQHESFLNVVGASAVVARVVDCWSSLFSDRAVAYRIRAGIDHSDVAMAVLIQRMVDADASGVLFTADPKSGHRRVTVIESTFGLAESLVSGTTTSDSFRVRDGIVAERSIATKEFAVVSSPDGGTVLQNVTGERRETPSLTDAQALHLADIGRRIEAHFGCPQDIEWCLDGDEVTIVQSRPITTLFPIPPSDDDANHVYISVGHQQMMTDPMKPLGLSMWKLTAMPPMHEAAGRLFVDVAATLASPARAGFIGMVGTSDPLIGDALRTVIDRDDIVPPLPPPAYTGSTHSGPTPSGPPTMPPIEPDESIVDELIANNRASVDRLRQDIQGRSGPELFDFILADIPEMKRILFDPRSYQVFTTAMDATHWLNDHLEEWLGIKSAADPLALSVPHNVTSEMGLELMDVADVVRSYPEVIESLRRGDELRHLDSLVGGTEARQAIDAFLVKYGMRCVGEIDISRPRWIEDPSALIPVILGHVDKSEPGAGRRRFEEGQNEALATTARYLDQLATLPDGAEKANEVRKKIALVRAFIGYREYPKYGLVCRYLVYKQALMAEAARLTEAGVFDDPEDCSFLSVEEFAEVARSMSADRSLIAERREAFASYHSFTPPRVLTSDGEVFSGEYRRSDVPGSALVGLGVSAGIIEGRARVVADIRDADLEAGDILVTAFTDPSWTPVFVAIAGLVTEVGGLMTHGAVVAREYGLPAVVGVQRATSLIRDGQRIRLNGTDGYVEILS